jgi:hypothetical protein
MKYFFDESGNWEQLDRNRRPLLMCGVAFPKRNGLDEVKAEFASIRARHKLTPYEFHSADVDQTTLDSVCRTIEAALRAGKALAMARRVPLSSLRRTRISTEDLYIEHASALLAALCIGDAKPDIHSDMKFRGGYVAKVVEMANNPDTLCGHVHIDRMIREYLPRQEFVPKLRQAITRKIDNALSRRSPSAAMKDFEATLKDEDKCVADLIARYEFMELWLNWKESEQVREKYRTMILAENTRISANLQVDAPAPVVSLSFHDKGENVCGVQFADFLCGLLSAGMADAPPDAAALTNSIASLVHWMEVSR